MDLWQSFMFFILGAASYAILRKVIFFAERNVFMSTTMIYAIKLLLVVNKITDKYIETFSSEELTKTYNEVSSSWKANVLSSIKKTMPEYMHKHIPVDSWETALTFYYKYTQSRRNK